MLHSVRVPAGAVLVTSAPSGPGMKWDSVGSQWIADPDYTPPPSSPPTAMEILDLLVERGILTESDAQGLLGGQ